VATCDPADTKLNIISSDVSSHSQSDEISSVNICYCDLSAIGKNITKLFSTHAVKRIPRSEMTFQESNKDIFKKAIEQEFILSTVSKSNAITINHTEE
jgi:hypothetical protein